MSSLKWAEALKQLKNPQSGKSLIDEDRLVEMQENNGEIVVKYKRDQISLEMKKNLESQMYAVLSEYADEEKITILSVSEEQQQAKPATQAAPAAQLKTGHGPTGQAKRKVANVKKVIAVSSCKGGVGKSTVAVNLCLALKNQGYKVGLIDADIYGPSIPMLLGKRDAKPGASEEKKILPVEAHGLKFISFGLFINESDPVIWRGPMLGGVLNQFLFDVDWGELDFLVIDLPPGTGDMQLSMIQATDIDGALIVSTPQNIALLDAKKGMAMFSQVNVPILGMVENMSYFVPEDDLTKKYFIYGNGGVEAACKELSAVFLGSIPFEIPLREGSDMGVPYMTQTEFEGRPVWKAFENLGKSLSEGLMVKPAKKGFLERFF